ncbi:MAG: hypothetical protein ACO3UW_09820, partial [Candidatus Nanopelagicales bacterium]
IDGIAASPGSRLLGLPLRVAGERVDIVWHEGAMPTHVESLSPDLWLRPESFAAARDRLSTWLREST